MHEHREGFQIQRRQVVNPWHCQATNNMDPLRYPKRTHGKVVLLTKFPSPLITGCTTSCQNNNFQCSQWPTFRQLGYISGSVAEQILSVANGISKFRSKFEFDQICLVIFSLISMQTEFNLAFFYISKISLSFVELYFDYSEDNFRQIKND